MSRRILLSTCVAGALFLSAPTADAQVANGSFETGTFSSWTVTDIPTPHSPMAVGGLGYDPGSIFTIFGFFAGAPTDGSWAAFNGFDGSGPGVIQLEQDVTVNLPNLAFDIRAGWDMLNYPGSTMDRTFSVIIEPSGGGAALQTTVVLTATAGTLNNDTGDLNETVDLSSFLGQTVRLKFEWDIPESFTGPAAFQLDNIRLEAGPGPALSLAGSCPGAATINGSGMTPGGLVYIGYSAVVASWTIPAGSCAGTVIPLTSPSLLFAVPADGAGNVSIAGNIPPTACGVISMLSFDVTTCTPSNTLAL